MSTIRAILNLGEKMFLNLINLCFSTIKLMELYLQSHHRPAVIRRRPPVDPPLPNRGGNVAKLLEKEKGKGRVLTSQESEYVHQVQDLTASLRMKSVLWLTLQGELTLLAPVVL